MKVKLVIIYVSGLRLASQASIGYIYGFPCAISQYNQMNFTFGLLPVTWRTTQRLMQILRLFLPLWKL